MSSGMRFVLRGVVVVAGSVVMIASVLAFRFADWPIYAVFLLVQLVVFFPAVTVMPGVTIGIAQLTTTIAFLYIGGLPIIVLTNVLPAIMRLLRPRLPAQLQQLVADRHDLLSGGARIDARLVGEIAMFSIGLGVRWWIISVLAPGVPPTAAPWAVAIAEICGQQTWGLLSILPIYPDRTMLPLPLPGGLRTAFVDMALITGFSVTSFVFVIIYGYRAEGLLGAAAWSLATLGLHFMLKRLTDRRLKVEDQNQRLAALNRELEHRERLSAIGKMSSVISHQILQQLGVIGLYADLIRNAENGGEPAAQLAQAAANAAAIEGALRDVNRVLTDLLVFSKDLRLNLYEQPLAQLIEECLDDCRAEATSREVSLRSQCPSAITITLDKLKMKQAIGNVVRNAVEASPRGGAVQVQAALSNGSVEVTVSDQGTGIAAEDREAIFTPFFTTKEHGTGLGLAIARQFTEAHGGQLHADATPGVPGLHVVFRLPLRRAGS